MNTTNNNKTDNLDKRIEAGIESLNLKNAMFGGFDRDSVYGALREITESFLTEYDELMEQNKKLRQQIVSISAQKREDPAQNELLAALNQENTGLKNDDLKKELEAAAARVFDMQEQAAQDAIDAKEITDAGVAALRGESDSDNTGHRDAAIPEVINVAEDRFKNLGDIYTEAKHHRSEIIRTAYAYAATILSEEKQQADQYRLDVEKEISEKKEQLEAEQTEKRNQLETEKVKNQAECKSVLDDANAKAQELIQKAKDEAQSILSTAVEQSEIIRQDAESFAKQSQKEVQARQNEIEEKLRKMNAIMQELNT